MPKLLQWILAGGLVLAAVYYAGCRSERTRWVKAQGATQHWKDSTAVVFADSTARLAERAAQSGREAAAFQSSRDSAWIVANQAKAANSVSVQKMVGLKAAVAAARDTAELVGALIELTANQDTLIAGQRREISALRETVRTDSATIDKLHLQVASLNAGIHARDIRLVSLDSVIAKGVGTPAPIKFLGIPMPSRGVMFIAGVVGGAAGTLLLQSRKP